ncbi:multiple antibiotic resistance protein [Rhodovulum iodosum]|uniref:UPF0056 membrane protein n=1 Tax=Rhodovulum iodosum TaxID=68291 RepID=A0ABV3XXX5_9RHOB|nr:MarC family protein [Rhodovulum robiginosum]RSK33636.1 MarC family protein [Rhodovulum robiginosum]
MELTFYISAFVTLFVIVDPIGLAPLFVAITQGMPGPERRAIALRAAAIAVGLLTLFGVFGESVLALVGISMPAFRIAGGLLLFLTALEMLFERRTKRREDQAHDDRPDPSVFPLATPLIAGPGAMATMILLTGQVGRDPLAMLLIHLAMLAVVGIVLVLFLAAGPLERALGRTGTNVVTRLLGMLLAALSVQFVLDGLADFGLVPT